jgi:hypothetical protein
MTLPEKIISPKKLENAFNVLLRYNWQRYKQQIITQIETGIFDFCGFRLCYYKILIAK